MAFLPYIIFLLIFGCIFILVSQYFFYKEIKKFIKERFVQAPAAETEKKEEKIFWLKVLLQPLSPINARLGSSPFREKINHRLVAAGLPLTVDEYFLFKELSVLFAFLSLGVLIGWQRLMGNPILIFVACGIGFLASGFWLKSRIEARKKEVLRSLPNIIDLLILAVDAGLDFMIAVRRVVQRSRPGPIVDELFHLWQEVRMGRARRDALKNMSRRWNIPEVDSFVRTLVQAERMGTPIGEALRTLSEEIRIRQFQRGEQQALKAPIKMLFPLLFCILPVVLILVGGPVVLQFFQSGISFFQ